MKSIAEIIHHKTFTLYIFDDNDNTIYYEQSNGYWIKQQYDSNGLQTYYENAIGEIEDERS